MGIWMNFGRQLVVFFQLNKFERRPDVEFRRLSISFRPFRRRWQGPENLFPDSEPLSERVLPALRNAAVNLSSTQITDNLEPTRPEFCG